MSEKTDSAKLRDEFKTFSSAVISMTKGDTEDDKFIRILRFVLEEPKLKELRLALKVALKIQSKDNGGD